MSLTALRRFTAVEGRDLNQGIETLIAARNGRDWGAMFAELDPDPEWAPIAENVVFRGREAITEYFERWDAAWEEFRVDVQRIEVAPDEDRTLVGARYWGRGKGSAVEVNGNFYTVWELRDGKVWRCREYPDEGEARAAFERRR